MRYIIEESITIREILQNLRNNESRTYYTDGEEKFTITKR